MELQLICLTRAISDYYCHHRILDIGASFYSIGAGYVKIAIKNMLEVNPFVFFFVETCIEYDSQHHFCKEYKTKPKFRPSIN